MFYSMSDEYSSKAANSGVASPESLGPPSGLHRIPEVTFKSLLQTEGQRQSIFSAGAAAATLKAREQLALHFLFLSGFKVWYNCPRAAASSSGLLPRAFPDVPIRTDPESWRLEAGRDVSSPVLRETAEAFTHSLPGGFASGEKAAGKEELPDKPQRMGGSLLVSFHLSSL